MSSCRKDEKENTGVQHPHWPGKSGALRWHIHQPGKKLGGRMGAARENKRSPQYLFYPRPDQYQGVYV
jgi:hypothetical protein